MVNDKYSRRPAEESNGIAYILDAPVTLLKKITDSASNTLFSMKVELQVIEKSLVYKHIINSSRT